VGEGRQDDSQRVDEDIADCRTCADLEDNGVENPGEETGERAECFVDIRDGPAGAMDDAADLGKASEAERDGSSADQVANERGGTEDCCDQSGQDEDAAADCGVDGIEGDSPWIDDAAKLLVGAAGFGAFLDEYRISRQRRHLGESVRTMIRHRGLPGHPAAIFVNARGRGISWAWAGRRDR